MFLSYTLFVAGCRFLAIYSDKVHERFVIMECLIVSGKISVSLEVGVADTAFYSSRSPVFVMDVSLVSNSVGFTSECLLTDAALLHLV